MNSRSVAAVAAASLVLGCAPSRAPAPEPAPAPMMAGMQHADGREAIQVPAIRRDMILMEMRGLLTAVNGVLRGLDANDTALMRSSAASAGMETMRAQMQQQRRQGMPGMQGMHQGPAEMNAMMPAAFRQLGMATHDGFDSLATAIRAGASREQVLHRLATLTNNCVGCHQAFRLEVVNH